MKRHLLAALAAFAVAGVPAWAQTIRVVFDAEWTALDPHFHSFPYNLSVAHHLFDALTVEPQDLDAARRLLIEAGYANGFEFRISTPADRNMNGRRVTETIAAQLTRIGIRTNVNAVPLNVWLAEWRRGQYSAIMHGAGPVPVPWTLLPQMVATKDTAAGLGASNESFYSNAEFDRLVKAALGEIDQGKREALLHQAARIVRHETAVIALHHEAALWASRAGLNFTARSDTLTYVTDIAPGR
jgi:peptide/nickel transport system substrate-binding protein